MKINEFQSISIRERFLTYRHVKGVMMRPYHHTGGGARPGSMAPPRKRLNLAVVLASNGWRASKNNESSSCSGFAHMRGAEPSECRYEAVKAVATHKTSKIATDIEEYTQVSFSHVSIKHVRILASFGGGLLPPLQEGPSPLATRENAVQ